MARGVTYGCAAARRAYMRETLASNRVRKATKYPELESIARTIADATCVRINRECAGVASTMTYREQYTLERIIGILQERV